MATVDPTLPVVIIGGGAAGLTAAREFQLAGKDYLLLEGRDRLGGRVHTTDAPENFELGAAWFHDAVHNKLERIAAENEVDAVYDDHTVKIYNGKGGLNPNLISTISDRFEAFRFTRDPHETLDEARTLFLTEFSNNEEKDVANSVAFLYQLVAGVKLTQLSSHTPAPQGRDMAVQGYQNFVVNVLGKDIDQEKVKLNTKVTRIEASKNGDKVIVSTQDGETIEGSSVVVTVPVGVLKQNSIQFEPQLNDKLSSSIEKTAVTSIEKVYLTFDESFWDQTVSKFIVSDQDSQSLIWNFGSAHPGTQFTNTLVVLTSNDVAREVSKSPQNAFEIVKPILQSITGKQIPDPKQVTVSNWVKDIFSAGSFTTVPNDTTREELATPFIHGEPQNRLFFAGEHAVIENAGLVQGAWESGKRAAEQVLKL